jgi:hypothetical protein
MKFGETKKLPDEGFNRPWPPCGDEALGERRLTLIQMDAVVKVKVERFQVLQSKLLQLPPQGILNGVNGICLDGLGRD